MKSASNQRFRIIAKRKHDFLDVAANKRNNPDADIFQRGLLKTGDRTANHCLHSLSSKFSGSNKGTATGQGQFLSRTLPPIPYLYQIQINSNVEYRGYPPPKMWYSDNHVW